MQNTCLEINQIISMEEEKVCSFYFWQVANASKKMFWASKQIRIFGQTERDGNDFLAT